MTRVLVIGYGNPGRRDDGLGPLFAVVIEKLKIPNVSVDSDYQLIVEDAHVISEYDVVIFVDADAVCVEPFYFKKIQPATSGPGFSSHSVTPAEVLALARQLFSSKVRAYVLGIRGYEFEEFGEGLSERATKNFEEAKQYIINWLREFHNMGCHSERSEESP